MPHCAMRGIKNLHRIAVLLVVTVGPGTGQTRIDLRSQGRGLTADGVAGDARHGGPGKFQMFGGVATQNGGIAVYDATGNLIAADCAISAGSLSCGEGNGISTIVLPELSINGSNAFVIHGAPEQPADGCIVLKGQPSDGQVLRATGNTLFDDDGRTCVVMEWAASALTNLNQIPTRRYVDLQEIPTAFVPTAHADTHRHGGADEVGSATPAPHALVKAGSTGLLASGWLPSPGAAAKGGVLAAACGTSGQFVQSINTDGSITCATPPGGASVSVPWLSGADRSSTWFLGQPNQVRVFGFSLLYPVSFSRIIVNVSTADTTGCGGSPCSYAWGIYSHAGALVAATTPAVFTTTGTKDLAIAGEGPVTLGSGQYYFSMTGTGTTLVINAGAANFLQFASNQLVSPGSSNAQFSSSITPPGDNWALLDRYPYFGLR